MRVSGIRRRAETLMKAANGLEDQHQPAPQNSLAAEAFPDLKALGPEELLKYAGELQKENRRLVREKRRLQNELTGLTSSPRPPARLKT
jgi:hypothetical protein